MEINHRVTINLQTSDGVYLSALVRTLEAIDNAYMQTSGTPPMVHTSGDSVVAVWTEDVS